MKKYLFILLAALTFVACNNEEPGIDSVDKTPRSLISDPEHLGPTYCHVLDSTDFYCLEHYSLAFFLPEKRMKDVQEYWDSIDASVSHEPLNYRNMRLLLCQGWVGKNHANEFTEDDYRAAKEYSKITQDATSKLTLTPGQKRSMNQSASDGEIWDELNVNTYSTCLFALARHTGKFSITADQTLFGQPAGTDLSEHFMVKGENKCLPQGTLQNFDFVFWYNKKQPELNAREFFAKDTWLQEEHVLWLRDIPEEQYEVINFNIQMPVICEYWTKYFREHLTEVPVTDNVYTYQCSVSFGKTSTFESDFRHLHAINPRIEWICYE